MSGAADETAFFHINGVTGDAGNSGYHLLKNDDDGGGLTHVRYTNCVFASDGTDVTEINIDRTKVGGGSTCFASDERGILSTGWDDGPNQGNDVGFVADEYPFGDCGSEWCNGTGGFTIPGSPANGVSGPLGRGAFYAHNFGRANGGGPGIFGSATQHVDLAPHAGQPFRFAAWLASSVRDTDYAIVSLEVFSQPVAQGDLLWSIIFDGNDPQSSYIVGSANSMGVADPAVIATQDNWTLYQAEGVIAHNAASAAVTLRDATVSGVNGDDGYVDLVSLQVIPEPSSIVLLLSVAVPLFFWWRRNLSGRAAHSSKAFQ